MQEPFLWFSDIPNDTDVDITVSQGKEKLGSVKVSGSDILNESNCTIEQTIKDDRVEIQLIAQIRVITGDASGQSSGRDPGRKYVVGEKVKSLYENGDYCGYWYQATIVKVNADGTYTLAWEDGGTEDTVKPASKIRDVRIF